MSAKGQHEVLEDRMVLESQRSETKPVVDLVERADLGWRGQVFPLTCDRGRGNDTEV